MISSGADVYLDLNGLNDIRRQSRTDEKKALREVAQQFEQVFLKMMLKSMRDASFGDPLFDSDTSQFYREMYDDQLTTELSKNGSVGLADVLVEQMGQYLPQQDGNKPVKSAASAAVEAANQMIMAQRRRAYQQQSAPVVNEAPVTREKFEPGNPESFLQKLYPLAKRSARELGVQPEVLLAQAALETGWGSAVIRKTDGSSSHNLFNIKADSRWDGGSAQVATLEYRGGIAQKEQARFRTYDSYEQSFADYVDFIKNSPRYSEAVKHAANSDRYVEELQTAGYATDPLYADKIKSIMQRQPMTALQLADASSQTR